MIPYWKISWYCIAGVLGGKIGVGGVRLRFTRLALYFVLAITNSQYMLVYNGRPTRKGLLFPSAAEEAFR